MGVFVVECLEKIAIICQFFQMKESEEILPVSRRDDFNLELKRVSTKMVFVLNDDITSS